MAESTSSTTARTAAARRGLGTFGIVAICASAVVGANLFGLRDDLLGAATPTPKPVAVSPFASIRSTGKRRDTVLRSQPWWQGVDKLQGGNGTSTPSFTIDGSAAQWRASWSCQRGRIIVRVVGRTGPLVDAACPGTGTGFATRTGNTNLSVTAGGAWKLQVDQQVDVPLVERPLPAMTAPGAATVFTGAFYRIDQAGIGRLSIYRLPTGKYALRLASFYVTPNVDLQIRLSPLASPRTTRQFLSAASALVARLDITAGSLNFIVPSAVNPMRYRSMVIWCPLINSAYAAASLKVKL